MELLRRPRRNRQSLALRDLIQEHRLHPSDFIVPLFVIPGSNQKIPIESMPPLMRFSADILLIEIDRLVEKGIRGIALFPHIPREQKDSIGSQACRDDGLIPQTVLMIKEAFPELLIICDVALDPYTTHGHDGIVDPDGRILNDETVSVLESQALVLASAGCDFVAPSDMMDGRVKAIRQRLDVEGFIDVGILSYCAKYASSLYTPFREAVGSSLYFGDKRTYQMNPANIREALLEAQIDHAEGADILLIKPASLYLDVIHQIRVSCNLPIAAYHVSGEYAMVIAAAKAGYLDPEKVFTETLLSIKRAGADIIFTYAIDFLSWI